MQIGSNAHRDLFVDTFLEDHRRYEPADLHWPELSSEHLELLRSLRIGDQITDQVMTESKR